MPEGLLKDKTSRVLALLFRAARSDYNSPGLGTQRTSRPRRVFTEIVYCHYSPFLRGFLFLQKELYCQVLICNFPVNIVGYLSDQTKLPIALQGNGYVL